MQQIECAIRRDGGGAFLAVGDIGVASLRPSSFLSDLPNLAYVAAFTRPLLPTKDMVATHLSGNSIGNVRNPMGTIAIPHKCSHTME